MSRNFAAASSQYLSVASNSDLQAGDIDYTLSIHVYLASTGSGANKWFVSKTTSGFTSIEWLLGKVEPANPDRFRFQVYNGTTAVGTADANNLGAPSANTWYHIVAWHNAVSNQISIQVNGGTPDVAATTGSPATNTASFLVGTGDTTQQYMNGRLAELAYWKSTLGSEERLALAKGVSPLLIRPATLVEYWPLMGRYSPEIGLKKGYALTLTNSPTVADHPKVIYPRGVR